MTIKFESDLERFDFHKARAIRQLLICAMKHNQGARVHARFASVIRLSLSKVIKWALRRAVSFARCTKMSHLDDMGTDKARLTKNVRLNRGP